MCIGACQEKSCSRVSYLDIVDYINIEVLYFLAVSMESTLILIIVTTPIIVDLNEVLGISQISRCRLADFPIKHFGIPLHYNKMRK